jgi:hypothetical protein
MSAAGTGRGSSNINMATAKVSFVCMSEYSLRILESGPRRRELAASFLSGEVSASST